MKEFGKLLEGHGIVPPADTPVTIDSGEIYRSITSVADFKAVVARVHSDSCEDRAEVKNVLKAMPFLAQVGRPGLTVNQLRKLRGEKQPDGKNNLK